MPEESVPPVVAVVVSNDPGPWFEECLESLRDQDYLSLSVLVVDAASEPALAPRVAAVAPGFFLRRLEENRGFGPSANSVLGVVEGATHLLFCHDDVVLEEDVVRRMVEEAFRQNAGIVGPKLVDPDEPDRILQLGLGVDRFGAPVRRVERREFDQAQHDEVQETFAVPGGCTLVRADLFGAIGGFDEEISMFGEDIDLCWRARLAGARAFVVPQAVVAHFEAASSRRRELREARSLQWRHELRSVMKNYGRVRRMIVVAELALLSLAEMLYFVLVGRGDRARQVRDAWRWNLQKSRNLKEAREAVAEFRRISDYELHALFTRRTFRVWRFVQPRVEDTLLSWGSSGRHLSHLELERFRQGGRRSRTIAALSALLVLVVFFGCRSLIFGHLPLIGGYLPLPSPGTLFARYLGGQAGLGVGRIAPGSPALLVLGLLGIVTIGGMGIALKIVIFGSILLGAIGISRLLRPHGGPGVRLVGAAAYLFLPLVWNDIATGGVLALIAYGAAPFVLSRVLNATGVTPYAKGPAPSTRRGIARELLGFGLVLALFGSFVPAIAVGAVLSAAAVAIGCAALGEWRAGLRSLAVSFGALVVAFVLTMPWSLSFATSGVTIASLTGAPADPTLAPQLGSVMRLQLGPYGAGLLGLGLFISALFVLIAARRDRYRVALVIWFELLATIVITWAASEGWLGSGGSALQVLAAPLACGLAVVVALGAGVVADDVVGGHFGWRHLSSIAFAVFACLGALPMIGAALPGRYKVPTFGDEAVLDWIHSAPAGTDQRLLFVGESEAIPGFSFGIGSDVSALVSSPGLPDALSLFPGGNAAALAPIAKAINAAESGSTIRLGSALAPLDIRYLVITESAAPALAGEPDTTPAPAPELLLDALTAQSDLHELPNEAGVLIFVNTKWRGTVGTLSGGVPAVLRSLAVAAELVVLFAIALYYGITRHRRRQEHHRRRRHRHELGYTQPVEDEPREAVLVGDAP